MGGNYDRARRIEDRLVRQWREAGAILAQRTAGSHSAVDVLGIFPSGVRLAQVKLVRRAEDLSGAAGEARKEMCRLPAIAGVSREVYVALEGARGWAIHETI